MTEALVIDQPEDLLAREAKLREGGATPRMRDAAAALGVPEAALVEARRATGGARRLRRPEVAEGFGAVLARLPEAGEVMGLTRNEACVHEVHARYSPPEFQGAMGQVVGDIDLRLFTRRWAYGYLLAEESKAGLRKSLQFFDGSGTAIHKVYALGKTDVPAFERIAADFGDRDAAPARFEPVEPPAADRPDAEIDAGGLRDAWEALGHTHEFYGLLRRFGVGRGQAMRLAGRERAREVPAAAIRRVLETAAGDGLPVMIFVGNPGCVQIYSGPVNRIEVMGPWLNVLDPGFNLHLREDMIRSAWVVRKPTSNGDIHSLELYDAAGEVIVQIFGDRKGGGRERPDWRTLVTGLADPAAC